MPLDLVSMPPPTNPLERSTADLWVRTAGPMSLEDRKNFRLGNEKMIDSWLVELLNQSQHRVPDPVDYVEMRRSTFGSDLTMNLARITKGRDLPAAVFESRALQALELAAQDYCCFLNDIFSYQKEIEFEGEVNNIVLVLQKFLDVGKDEALVPRQQPDDVADAAVPARAGRGHPAAHPRTLSSTAPPARRWTRMC
jgi:germacradienol/geosmin synthase